MKYQFVNWFPEFVGFGFVRLNISSSNLALIYDWSFRFGFCKLRKWHKITSEDLQKSSKIDELYNRFVRGAM